MNPSLKKRIKPVVTLTQPLKSVPNLISKLVREAWINLLMSDNKKNKSKIKNDKTNKKQNRKLFYRTKSNIRESDQLTNKGSFYKSKTQRGGLLKNMF